jgi:hypothetical protein
LLRVNGCRSAREPRHSDENPLDLHDAENCRASRLAVVDNERNDIPRI